MKSIILKGGLGNQLFQLAKFIDLKNNLFKDIKLDISTGFLLDFKYHRKFEINILNKKQLVISNTQSIKNLIIIILNKKFQLLIKLFKINIIDDNNLVILRDYKSKNVIFNGYFQNFEIVNSNLYKIYEIVKPYFETKKSLKFERLISRINNSRNSVALCIRFYEESIDALKHAATNSIAKEVDDYNKIIKHFEKKFSKPTFFIFVQNENEFTRKLKFNSKFYIVSHAKGFLGSWDRLTAQAHCKHHIFNNSTFYYWGAIFSQFLNINKDLDSEIYISNNFIFENIYNPKWKKF